MTVDEINGMFGVPLGKHFLFWNTHVFNSNFSIFPELKRIFAPMLRIFRVMFPHVIGIHKATGFVKTTGMRAGIRLVAAMPFPEQRSFVTCCFKYFTNGRKSSFQSTCFRAMSAKNLGAARIAP